MDDTVGSLPHAFFEVHGVGAMIPGHLPASGLSEGANCQRHAYAVLRHFGLDVPDHPSSELWADDEALMTVWEPSPPATCCRQ